MQCDVDEKEESKVGLAHYLRKDPHPNPHAPRLVIALRGTKLNHGQDLGDDIKIVFETLHKSSRFDSCQKLVKKLSTEFRQKYDHESEAKICVTGHSLGAAITLLVTKNLAAEGIRVEAHLFNPPFLTALSLVRSGFILPRLREKIRSSHLSPLLTAASRVKDGCKVVLAAMFGDRHQLAHEYIIFAKLADWVPRFYVNEHDTICKKYIRFYQKNHGKAGLNSVSSQGMVSRLLGRDAKYFTMVPSADLYVCSMKNDAHTRHGPAFQNYPSY